jgi:hypothetical protein
MIHSLLIAAFTIAAIAGNSEILLKMKMDFSEELVLE